jgi:crossover junction endodeoxyribonuclease RuvC
MLPVPADNSGFDKVILGIDPGTNIMGYGILGCKGVQYQLLSIGIIQLQKIDGHALKLRHIFERCLLLIEEYKPDELAIEAPFFGKNVQSMLKLGRAQGVAIAAALYRDIPIFEYAPKKIKQSITGNGNASKEQVASMMQALLKFEEMPKNLDATDAIAAAMCHYFQSTGAFSGTANKKGSSAKKSYSGWDAFLKANPDRGSV